MRAPTDLGRGIVFSEDEHAFQQSYELPREQSRHQPGRFASSVFLRLAQREPSGCGHLRTPKQTRSSGDQWPGEADYRRVSAAVRRRNDAGGADLLRQQTQPARTHEALSVVVWTRV